MEGVSLRLRAGPGGCPRWCCLLPACPGSSLPVPAAPASLLPGGCFQRCLTRASGQAGAEGQQGLAVDTGGVLITLSPQPRAERGRASAGSGSVVCRLCGRLGAGVCLGGTRHRQRNEQGAWHGAGRASSRDGGAGCGCGRGCGMCEHPWKSMGEGVAAGWIRLEGLTESCGNARSAVETAAGCDGGAAPRCSSCRCKRSRTWNAAVATATPRCQRRAQGEPAAGELPDRHGQVQLGERAIQGPHRAPSQRC